MKKSIFYTFGLALAAIAFASCDDFLDKMPDSRAELDTEEKVVKMLVSAYPDNTYNMCAEFSSDNVDMIPNLVNTVKGYAAHESQTFEAVTEARAKATSINLSADDLTPEKLAEFQQAQAQVRSALGRLIAVSESYPDLKANQNFLELQAQLEGTENRISVARKEFNEVAKTYNVAVRRFPANLVAKLFGFGQKPYFEAAEGTETAPQVQF